MRCTDLEKGSQLRRLAKRVATVTGSRLGKLRMYMIMTEAGGRHKPHSDGHAAKKTAAA
jgi:hypothetical protein